jgi:hypothetical protein
MSILSRLANAIRIGLNGTVVIEPENGMPVLLRSEVHLDDALKFSDGSRQSRATVSFVGMVSCAEVNAAHDPTTGSLPVIDEYQTLENDRVFLCNQGVLAGSFTKDNGVWVVHEHSPWERPADFAHGMTIQSGALIFIRSGIQMNNCWMQLDNAVDDQITFTIGTTELNSLSRQAPGLGQTEAQQGPLVDMLTWGRTDSTSAAGKGVALAMNSIDLNGQTVVGLPETDPGVAGALWNDGGTVKVSSGGGAPPEP